ncbi:helix-turn-helix domain-containing protein [Paenibacillus kobensis]|uniref:helix-turn-helix domain-containing protein n=1 Tax=Paenibacillus kobensis TaxID=59841 RepID=UPI000FD75563|nr:helix-turn-helix transcriptional regulator [Paenibacillus kobensis]
MLTATIVMNKEYVEGEMRRRGINSTNELAREIGISDSMMSLLMRGKRNPGPKAVGLMLEYFGVTYEKIFTQTLTKVHKSA